MKKLWCYGRMDLEHTFDDCKSCDKEVRGKCWEISFGDYK